MRTGQRDVHNTPLKRRLSITYEELETLKKSIKVSVLNELREEMENISDQESLKDTVLSEIRTELMGIPDPALLKASILKELKIELNNSKEQDFGKTDRRVKEISGIQDGLVRELLDQKILIKKLENEVENLTKKLDDLKKSPSQPLPLFNSHFLMILLIFLLFPECQNINPDRKPLQTKNGWISRTIAPLPGASTKVRLKLKQVEPKELDEEKSKQNVNTLLLKAGIKDGLKGI